MSMLSHALNGVRVLDLSQGIAGPHAGSLAAEMGAEVIKVEPMGGDWLRTLGYKANGSSVLFGTFNKGKKGVSIDLKDDDVQQMLRGLVTQFDVVIENGRPGVMQRLGLDYETLSRLNPKLIYLSISGFGQSGPMSDQPATDAAIQAFSGLSFGAGDMQSPVRVRISIVDIVSGLYASQAILAALVQRGVTGRGQHIPISLMHCISAVQSYKFAEYEATGGAIARELFAAIGIYRTSDGFIAISAMRDQQVVDLVNLIGKSHLLHEATLDTPIKRFENQDRLREEISNVLSTHTSDYWLPRMTALDLICQSVQDYGMFRSHPQVLHEEIFVQTDLGEVGVLPSVRMPGLEPSDKSDPAPSVGRDTRNVLVNLGVSPDKVDALIARGALKQAS